MDLGSLGPREVQQYLQGADFPLNKDDAIKVAQDNGAPDPGSGPDARPPAGG